jgi:hypothetical protein
MADNKHARATHSSPALFLSTRLLLLSTAAAAALLLLLLRDHALVRIEKQSLLCAFSRCVACDSCCCCCCCCMLVRALALSAWVSLHTYLPFLGRRRSSTLLAVLACSSMVVVLMLPCFVVAGLADLLCVCPNPNS